MASVEDDRPAAGYVADCGANILAEHALHRGHAPALNDGVDVDGRPLAREHQQGASPIAGDRIPWILVLRGDPHLRQA
ncbi:MAG TPA: hypothetical protein VKT83_03715 [bacterium]|nr:hypothetical protein [bacterium]